MIVSGDGRRVGVKPNGLSYVTILDERGHSHTIDFHKARQLAEALDTGADLRVGTNHGRVLALQGFSRRSDGLVPEMETRWLLGDASVHMPAGRPQTPSGPWVLDDDARKRLAEEIRRVMD